MAEVRPLSRAAWWTTTRWPPSVLDAIVALVVVIAVGVLPAALGHDPNPERPWGIQVGTLVVAFALLLWRRRWPLVVLVCSVSASVALMALADGRNILVAVTVIAIFTVAAETDRRTAWLAGAATALVLFTASFVVSGESWLAPANVGVIAWTGMATAVGDAVRSRRAYVIAVEERAVRAEQTREEEARRRVAEERLHIARELHDVLAHHIALINVQAAVATHVLRDSPDQAEQALGHVRRASRAVLDELSALVNVLRDSEESASPMEPAPGLDRLPRLLDSFRSAGLRVESVLGGERRALPAPVDLTAYRIVQEALTNVHKHGGGAGARLRLEYTQDALRIEVANVGGTYPSCADPGTGHGIIGMRERATSVGGWVVAGSVAGGPFRLQARMPFPATEPATPSTGPVRAEPPHATSSSWEGGKPCRSASCWPMTRR